MTVTETGERDGAELVATMATRGFSRALLLAGREHALHDGGIIARSIAVYAGDPLPIDARAIDALAGSVALLHSARAARRFADMVAAPSPRDRSALAAISRAVAEAAGPGWADIAAAPRPTTMR